MATACASATDRLAGGFSTGRASQATIMARNRIAPKIPDGVRHLDAERHLVGNKTGATRLGPALLLKFYSSRGRFPQKSRDLPPLIVEFVARQMQVEPAERGLYEWTGRTNRFHKAQIRDHLGFRECTVEYADKATL
ncbi:hypothetical protein Afil01_31760 [Actinorhabdospora filicis]|uniref:DUF4158 domain-containing protein n=1 Tax=Actinorhabdospora filicis TaxID=1785913 RepID=A0A9W6SM83_9ACTN|nr:DUF4158 domain-containing protein [Actinorhabdospora filicis]GLZ78369.1 hypothetical protein Afil01_31760 [Actinorhabdospora filicis]